MRKNNEVKFWGEYMKFKPFAKRIILIIGVLAAIILVLLIIAGCKSASYINTKDNIGDKDEMVIKEFRSHHGYSKAELKNLQIKYLGTVDGYKIFYVPFKGASGVLNENSWTKEGYTFPVECYTTIVGIKANKLYTIGELLHETQINTEKLYELLPNEFKSILSK